MTGRAAGMRQALKLHPDSRRSAATDIDVDAARPGPGGLLLRDLRQAVTPVAAGQRRSKPAEGPGVTRLWPQFAAPALAASPPAGSASF